MPPPRCRTRSARTITLATVTSGVFEEIALLQLPMNWWAIWTALQWPSCGPLVDASAVQQHAAELLAVDGDPNEDAIVQVAMLTPLEHAATVEAVAVLASQSGSDQTAGERIALLVALQRVLDNWLPDEPIGNVREAFDLFADAEWPPDMPPMIAGYLDGSVRPEYFHSQEGSDALLEELLTWRDREVSRLRTD